MAAGPPFNVDRHQPSPGFKAWVVPKSEHFSTQVNVFLAVMKDALATVLNFKLSPTEIATQSLKPAWLRIMRIARAERKSVFESFAEFEALANPNYEGSGRHFGLEIV